LIRAIPFWVLWSATNNTPFTFRDRQSDHSRIVSRQPGKWTDESTVGRVPTRFSPSLRLSCRLWAVSL
jgi:hypothetical protein